MFHVIPAHRILWSLGAFLEHAAAGVTGFILMVVGLGLGVTMIMPARGDRRRPDRRAVRRGRPVRPNPLKLTEDRLSNLLQP